MGPPFLVILFLLVVSTAQPAAGFEFRNNLLQVYGSQETCVSLGTLSNRMIIQSTIAKTTIACTQLCVVNPDCVEALFHWGHGETAGQCDLYNFTRGTELTLTAVDNCFRLTMKPCKNGGQYVDGICHCLPGFTGMYCDLVNVASCLENYQLVHHAKTFQATQSTTYVLDGRNQLINNTTNHYIKVSTDQLLTNHVAIATNTFHHPKGTIWGAQVLDSLTVIESSNGLEYPLFPNVNTFMVKSDGRLETLQYNLDNLYTGRLFLYGASKVYLRPSQAYEAFGSSGGSLSDVISAVKNGHKPSSFHHVVMYEESTGNVALKSSRTTMAITSSNTYQVPFYFFNTAFDGRLGRRYIYREKPDTLNSFGTDSKLGSWAFDSCWYPATRDPRELNQESIRHIRRAVLNGRRVRVVYEGISAQVKAVHVTSHHAIFQISPYVRPKYKGLMDSESLVEHTLVASSGSRKSCVHHMTISDTSWSEDFPIESDDMTWFVDSRPWQMAYVTSMDGLHLKGDLNDLMAIVQTGADVHIVIDQESGAYQLSLLAEVIYVGQTAVTAEVKSTLSVDLTPTDFAWPSNSKCLLTNFLVSTATGVKAIEYSYGPGHTRNHMDLSGDSGVVYWFVSL